MKSFTVTMTGTYFVTADNATQANDLVSEALIGNDPQDILGGGECHWSSADVKEGHHPTITPPPSTEQYNAKVWL